MYAQLPKGEPRRLIEWDAYCYENNIIKDITREEHDFGKSTCITMGPYYDSIFRFFMNMKNSGKAIHDKKNKTWSLV